MLKPVKCIKGRNKKATPKTRKELFTDGVRHVLDWASRIELLQIIIRRRKLHRIVYGDSGLMP